MFNRLYTSVAGVYLGFQQRIEGCSNLSGKYCTLSFEHYTTIAKSNFAVSLTFKKISDGTTLGTPVVGIVALSTLNCKLLTLLGSYATVPVTNLSVTLFVKYIML